MGGADGADAQKRVPTKMYSVWRAVLAPLPEFGEGPGVGSHGADAQKRVPTKVQVSRLQSCQRGGETAPDYAFQFCFINRCPVNSA